MRINFEDSLPVYLQGKTRRWQMLILLESTSSRICSVQRSCEKPYPRRRLALTNYR